MVLLPSAASLNSCMVYSLTLTISRHVLQKIPCLIPSAVHSQPIETLSNLSINILLGFLSHRSLSSSCFCFISSRFSSLLLLFSFCHCLLVIPSGFSFRNLNSSASSLSIFSIASLRNLQTSELCFL